MLIWINLIIFQFHLKLDAIGCRDLATTALPIRIRIETHRTIKTKEFGISKLTNTFRYFYFIKFTTLKRKYRIAQNNLFLVLLEISNIWGSLIPNSGFRKRIYVLSYTVSYSFALSSLSRFWPNSHQTCFLGNTYVR